MNFLEFLKKPADLFSKGFDVLFCCIFLVEFFSIFNNSSVHNVTMFLVAAFFLVTLINSFLGIWLFVAAIPLLNGLLLTKGQADIFLVFTALYCAWLPKQLYQKKSSLPSSPAGRLAFLLASMVLLNLFLVGVRIVEWPIPSRFWFSWVSHFPFVHQGESLWQVSAALIILKGIVLFRMVEVELATRKRWRMFFNVLYVQAVVIIWSSLAQLVDFKTRGVNYLGLYLPFNDIHSYGSYVVFLFLVFAAVALRGVWGKGACGGDQPADKSGYDDVKYAHFGAGWSLIKTIASSLFALIFFFLCLYSSSRVTWLVMAVVSFCLLFMVLKNKKIIICIVLVAGVAFGTGTFFASRLMQSDNKSLYRLGTLLNVKQLGQDKNLTIRFELWGRALRIIEEYPLAGIGIGNFYRNNALYKSRTMGRWDAENAHNYFLQVAAELGIPALVLFILLTGQLYYRQLAITRCTCDESPQKIFVVPLLFGLAAYLLTMITGHPLLLISQQFLFWSIIALISKGQLFNSHQQQVHNAHKRLPELIAIVSFFVFVCGFGLNMYRQGPKSIPVEYGLYAVENWDGVNMRWMAQKAEYYLPASADKLNLTVVAQPFNSFKPDGLILTVSVNNAVVDKVRFVEGGTKTLSYDVMSVNQQGVKVNLEVDKVFCPKKMGHGRDNRVLGVAIRSGS